MKTFHRRYMQLELEQAQTTLGKNLVVFPTGYQRFIFIFYDKYLSELFANTIVSFCKVLSLDFFGYSRCFIHNYTATRDSLQLT